MARATSWKEPPMIRRAAVLSLSALLALGGVAACGDDEDGDGGTTDEEIQEGEDTVDNVGDEVEEEVDSQDEGTNDDGE
jgi:hypothetical protein